MTPLVHFLRQRASSRQLLSLVVAGLIVAVYGSDQLRAEIPVRTVALTGDPVPGAADGVVFSRLFDRPVINNHGQIAFEGVISGTGVTFSNNTGIWSEGAGSLQLLARRGDRAPGTGSGTVFETFENDLNLGDGGQAAFSARLEGGDVSGRSNNDGLWFESGNALQLIARELEPVPGTGGSLLFGNGTGPDGSLVSATAISSAGELVFDSELGGSDVGSFDFGLFLYDGDETGIITKAGDPVAVSGNDDLRFGRRFLVRALLDDGEFFFSGGQVNVSRPLDDPRRAAVGVWRVDRTGEPDLVYLAAEPFPGIEPGLLVQSSGLSANALGDVAFRASLIGAGVDASNSSAVFLGQSDDVRLLARAGDPAPGLENGVKFGSILFEGFALNSSGGLVFQSFLAGPGISPNSERGIWFADDDSLELLVRDGQQPPGVEDGLGFNVFFTGSRVLVNGLGQVAFQARMNGPGLTQANNDGVWVRQPNGEIELLLREGEFLDVNDDPSVDDLRVIESFLVQGGSSAGSGLRSGFNELGQLAVSLSFTDGSSGMFVIDTFVIPEPSGLALVLMSVFLGNRRKRSASCREF